MTDAPFADCVSPADAIVKALEASIALTSDELTGHPDWSINMGKFWMALADQGYEMTRRTDG